MNKAQYRRLKILARDAEEEEQREKAYLDDLWHHYRICKQYYSFGDYLEILAAHKRTKRTYSIAIEWHSNMPPSGSNFWVVAIERPNSWAERELY